jgi:hypothetical protein
VTSPRCEIDAPHLVLASYESNVHLDGAENQDIDTVETQALDGDENSFFDLRVLAETQYTFETDILTGFRCHS